MLLNVENCQIHKMNTTHREKEYIVLTISRGRSELGHDTSNCYHLFLVTKIILRLAETNITDCKKLGPGIQN